MENSGQDCAEMEWCCSSARGHKVAMGRTMGRAYPKFLITSPNKEFEESEKDKKKRPKMEGQLLKYTNVMKGWQTRWFLLDPDTGVLEYFEKEEHKTQRPRGSVHLAAAVVSPSDEDSQTFTVTAANGETFKLRASDARERQHWVDRLRSTAEFHTANIAQHPEVYNRDGATTPRRMEGGNRGIYGSHENVQRMNRVDNRPQPLLEVQEYLVEANDYRQKLCNKIDSLPVSGDNCFMGRFDKDLLSLKATSGATINCIEQCLALLQNTQPVRYMVTSASAPAGQPADKKGAPMSSSMPAGFVHPVGTANASPTDSFVSGKSLAYTLGSSKIEAPIDHNDEVQDSQVYQDSELKGVEENKNVILHLLSQLKLGMDLTKVTLPTFILERRSLLEMFADCMAHPDLFLKIPTLESPEQRMLMVLEWYLTSFHAGRQGSVAKKPYNPIIGETFQCSWNIQSTPRKASPNTKSEASKSPKTSPKSDKKTDRASPKLESASRSLKAAGASAQPSAESASVHPKAATAAEKPQHSHRHSGRLLYCAEQVSHHPPISAFYFECPDKRICMNGSIYTKSKFMGMSLGVVLIGKVRLLLLDREEDYVFGLPSAYARSILTVPWVELGDKITLSCDKTNLSASIVFHTKPFYGGKLHRVSAEVKNVVTGDNLCKVSGEWNGTLEFTYADGKSKVIDTQKLPVKNKCVRPIALQGEGESRRLWQHVTNALLCGDVNTATEHKRFLEQRQREGERHRNETGTKFKPKFFQEDGDEWIHKRMPAIPSRSTSV